MNQFCDDVFVRNNADQLTDRLNRTVCAHLTVALSVNRFLEMNCGPDI